ncbi:D-ribitol-5-phosphate cytidylyltransferase-like [Liolophura sinensis]|uniref:D-ribitol-5-phosphate cytidylyltransferase-like n=1 Tax=Liolophura sinensis TaxID=3198878 RepID=UPI0031585ADB
MAAESNCNVCVVLPASGSGHRMCISTPKQYCKILDKPLLLFSIEAFHKLKWVKRIVVTVDKSHHEFVTGLMREHSLDKVSVVTGGVTRHRSIYAGIKALANFCLPSDVVLLHDAVRPLAEADVIKDVTVAAKKHGAAGVVRPLVSTVISVDEDGYLKESLDRSRYRASEMPQGFQYQVIKSAYEKCTDYDLDYGTECLHLAQMYTGTKSRILAGPDTLWKVTQRKDLYAAEGVLKERITHTAVVGCSDKSLISELSNHFSENFMQISFAKTLANVSVCATDVVHFQNVSDESCCKGLMLPVPEIMSHLRSINTSSLMLTPVLVHVNMYGEEFDVYEQQTNLQKQLATVINECTENMYLSAVIAKVSGDQHRLCELLKVMIRERSWALSGQVMVT